MKRILFSGDGSGGDLMPHVLMAREFQNAGYEVMVCGSREFARIAEDFGVPFAGYPHTYSELYLDKPGTGYIYNMREAVRHQEMLFQGEYDVLSQIAGDYDCLINFLAELFVPSVAQAFNIPNIKMMTFPVLNGDRYGVPAGLPYVTENKWINRIEWQFALFGAQYIFKYTKTVDRLRAQMGLGPTKNLLTDNFRCDHVMIGLYEELFPPDPSWERNFDYNYIGPCIPSDPVPLSNDLETFIAAGEKPIYIGFGSMRHADAEGLTRKLVDSVRDAGVRAIIAQSESTLGGALEDSDQIHVLRDYPIPHHVLFPRLAGAAHHGSWITTHLAAQAGVPQLVLPQTVDQFMWGDRVERAGLGPDWIDMNRLTTKKLCRGIEQLVGRPEYTRNATAFANRQRGIDGPKNALQTFQKLESRLEARTTVGLGPPSA